MKILGYSVCPLFRDVPLGLEPDRLDGLAFPYRCGDVLFWKIFCRPVVDGYQSTIGPLYHAYISEVNIAVVALVVVIAHHNLWSPRLALVFTPTGLDLEIITVPIGAAEPTVGQPHQGRGIGVRLCDRYDARELPRPAPVFRSKDLDRVVTVVILVDFSVGEHESIS